MKIETKYISPQMAEELLGTTAINRAVSRARVLQFANSMRSAKWQLNGETIIVSETGRLLDGQHRLFAVMQFGSPVQMTIVYGAKDNVFETIDTGRARTAGDILGMEGFEHPKLSAATAALIWRMYHNLGIGDPCDPWATCRILERYPAIQKWAGAVNGLSSRAVLPGSSFLAALTYLEDVAVKPLATQRFFDAITKGAGLDEGSPHLALRNRMLNMRAAGNIMNATTCWAPVARTLTAIESGELLNRISIEKSHAQIKRPALWAEHVANMPKGRRLDDLNVRDHTGGGQNEKFKDVVRSVRSRAPDATPESKKAAQ